MLFRDYACFILFLFSVVSLVSVVGIPLLPVFLTFLVRRVRLVRGTVEEGMVISGMVARVRYTRNGWMVWYVYQVQGETFKTRNVILGFRKPVQENTPVEVAYAMDDPSKAFLVHVYAPAEEVSV